MEVAGAVRDMEVAGAVTAAGAVAAAITGAAPEVTGPRIERHERIWVTACRDLTDSAVALTVTEMLTPI
jgi:hypothetical protein